MEFQDPVYGWQKVGEDVLLELIESGPVQRLKHVHQAGPTPFFIDKTPVTRFEHSVGVMLLLKKFDAPLEEQIAGLLHDVPHTAFSHLVDFIYRNDAHEYHEDFLEEIVLDSDIPEVLERHGLDVDYILDESNFRLLERELPDLCADRIDYFLRDTTVYEGKNLSHLLDALTVVDNRFAIEDRGTAEKYALRYIETDDQYWANPKEVAIFETMAEAMKEALDIGLITEEDLFGTDEEIMQLLRESDNDTIQEKLKLLDSDFEVVVDKDDYDFYGETKPRFVDPQVAEEDMARISELSDRVAEKIEQHREKIQSGYHIRIET